VVQRLKLIAPPSRNPTWCEEKPGFEGRRDKSVAGKLFFLERWERATVPERGSTQNKEFSYKTKLKNDHHV